MILHDLIGHVYTRFILALILCIIIAFVDKLPLFHETYMFYIILGITCMMLYTNLYDDYGFIILLIALLTLTYNNNQKQSANETKAS